jgi:electron transfer flavoprotein beta subunit
MSVPGPGEGPGEAVVACVKWAALRPDVDPLEGTLDADDRRSGFSESERAAVEVALQLAARRGVRAVALCVGPAAADPSLRELLAAGVDDVARVDVAAPLRSDEVAALLARALDELAIRPLVVCCGDQSADRGSGSVPAFLAHELGATQALGLVELEVTDVGSLRAVRRLDGGRRERLTVPLPAVVSVEGAVADLRRAPLSALLRAERTPVRVLADPTPREHHDEPRLRPWRPRPRVVPPPLGERALDRIVALTGALVERTPPRTVELEPAAAAEAILDQLRVWGYLPDGGEPPPADVVERVDEPPLLG